MATTTRRQNTSAANDRNYLQPPATGVRPPDPAFGALLTFRSLMEGALIETLASVRGQTAGLDRLWAMVEAYLQALLRRPVVQTLARSLPANQDQVTTPRGSNITGLLQMEMRHLSLTLPVANARLLHALIAETQRAEYQARQMLPQYRKLLREHLWTLKV